MKFKVTKGQIIHVLTPLIIVPASGWTATLVAHYFPGIPKLPAGAFEAIFILGSSAGLGTAIHYLHGWQWWERNVAPLVDVQDKLLAKGKVEVHNHAGAASWSAKPMATTTPPPQTPPTSS